jgi:hypothetical protein
MNLNQRGVASQSLSEALRDLPFPGEGKQATFGEVTRDLDDLAHNLVIFLIAAIGMIPAPPGTSFFLGLPLVAVAIQKACGLPLRLPGFVMRLSVTRGRFEAIKTRLLGWLASSERWIGPSMQWHSARGVAWSLDWCIVILALAMLIPLPLTAILPAMCICILTLGRLEADGRWIIAGLVGGALAVGIAGIVSYATLRLAALAFAA